MYRENTVLLCYQNNVATKKYLVFQTNKSPQFQ